MIRIRVVLRALALVGALVAGSLLARGFMRVMGLDGAPVIIQFNGCGCDPGGEDQDTEVSRSRAEVVRL